MVSVPPLSPSHSGDNNTPDGYRKYDHRDFRIGSTDSTRDLNQKSRERNSNLNDNDTSRQRSSLPDTRRALGLHPNAPLDKEDDIAEQQNLRWSRIRAILREPLVEFWGVVIMVVFGNGAMAQVLLSTGQTTAPGANGYGSYQNINWG